jgi:hypothetical protein
MKHIELSGLKENSQCLPEARGRGEDGTIWANLLHSKYCFRHLSSAIGTKQNVLTVKVTVKLILAGGNSRLFKRLRVLETIEWE